MKRLIFAFVMLLTATPVFAQTAQSVATKAYDQYKSAPRQFGSIIVDPSIAVIKTYDDNINLTETGKKSDTLTVVRPDLRIRSDFDMHELVFGASGSLGRYRRNDGENFDDYNVFGEGRLDVLDYGTYFTGKVQYQKAHEDRSSVDSSGLDQPAIYTRQTQSLGFVRALGIIKLALETAYDRLRFDNATRNGTAVDNSGRNRDVYSFGGKLSYEYFPANAIFISTLADRRNYSAAGTTRDSTGYETRLGTDIEISGKLSGDLYAGYLQRNYEGGLRNINAASYGGSLLWQITGITSLTGTLSRGVEETTLAESSGSVVTRGSLALEHALRPNILILPALTVVQEKFETNSEAGREDRTHIASLNLDYLPFTGVTASLGYRHAERDSNSSGGDYKDNLLILSLSKRF